MVSAVSQKRDLYLRLLRGFSSVVSLRVRGILSMYVHLVSIARYNHTRDGRSLSPLFSSLRDISPDVLFVHCQHRRFLAQNGREVDGFKTGLYSSALLSGIMGARFVKHRKFMPAGMLAGLGLASCAYHGKKMVEWQVAESDDETEEKQ